MSRENQITLYLKPDTQKKLEDLAKSEHRNMSNYLTNLIFNEYEKLNIKKQAERHLQGM